MADEFKGHPETIGEIRAFKSKRARDWSPRDLLIRMLREIDEGRLNPDVMVLCFAWVDDEKERNADWVASSPDPLMTYGVLSQCAYRINKASEDD